MAPQCIIPSFISSQIVCLGEACVQCYSECFLELAGQRLETLLLAARRPTPEKPCPSALPPAPEGSHLPLPAPATTPPPGIQDLTQAKTPIRRLLAAFKDAGPFRISAPRGRRTRVGGMTGRSQSWFSYQQQQQHAPSLAWVPRGLPRPLEFIGPGSTLAPPSPGSERTGFLLLPLSRGSGLYATACRFNDIFPGLAGGVPPLEQVAAQLQLPLHRVGRAHFCSIL